MSHSMMVRHALFVLVFAAGTALGAQARPSLASQARITRDSAQKLALAQVSGGRVKSAELEREHGKLIWSFDISVAGKSGIDEVQIDAVTGALVSNVHETPAMESAEAAADRRVAAARRARKP